MDAVDGGADTIVKATGALDLMCEREKTATRAGPRVAYQGVVLVALPSKRALRRHNKSRSCLEAAATYVCRRFEET